MSAALMRSECRKFSPNIFNKSKCTNCFRQKEEHSAEALDSNRATRKASKCGYLFVAPGWDFSNPLNRTKRWQRRWFVLYDDGELTYSVDEHPETVPQARIDMNTVLEVADADDVTGNAFSLAITAPDGVHFVKGTCREEKRWWAEVLSVFPRSKGRHKRNATFPGGQSTILPPSPTIRAATPSDPRPRFNSCHTEPPLLRHSPPKTWLPDVFPTHDVESPVSSPGSEDSNRQAYRDQPASSASPPTRDKIQPEEKARTRRVANREKRGIKSSRSFSEDLSGMLPSWRDRKGSASPPTPVENDVARRIIFDEFESESRRDEKLKDIAESLTRPRLPRTMQSTMQPTRDCAEQVERGDPDGCGLDVSSQRYSPSSELRVDLPAEDLLSIKKGWLMKQGLNKEWNKHWFVLRGAALMYYRDPTAEDKGIMDGVIDLSGVNSVCELQVARNYGFQTTTWDDKRYVLSAVTAGIRGNWMAALRRAAGLQDPRSVVGEQLERELDSTGSPTSVPCEPCIVPSVPRSTRSTLLSSDEEYRTASEGGRRESGEWGEPLTPLPPSPPLNRTPISRVKEKARSRVGRRSKSSPPSSRRSTLDSVPLSDAEESSVCSELSSMLCERSQEELQRMREAQELEELRRSYSKLIQEHEQLHTQSRQQDNWRELYQQIQERYRQDGETWERKACENADLTSSLQSEVRELRERLTAGIEENETLYQRIADLEGRGHALHGARDRGRSVDSLSDLTNIELDLDLDRMDKERVVEEYSELRGRFEKAVHEIRAMKRELRESHTLYDDLELSCISLRQEAQSREENNAAQVSLMVLRIEDLTLKLTASEKQVRTLKQKLAKSDSREKRRSLSLKGRESFQMCRELEEKIAELEAKVTALESGQPVFPSSPKVGKHARSESPQGSRRDTSRLRRKSLDSATSSEPMKVLIRLTSLEAKVAQVVERRASQPPAKPVQSVEVSVEPSEDTHAGCRGSAQDKVQSRLQEGLHLVTFLKAVCSGNSEPVESLECCLLDIQSLLAQMCNWSPVVAKIETDAVTCSVSHFESLLHSRLKELWQRHDSLRAAGTLTTSARAELLAERLAVEAVLAGRVASAVHTCRQPSHAFYRSALRTELTETHRLTATLHAKLLGNKTPGCDSSFSQLTHALMSHMLLHTELTTGTNLCTSFEPPLPPFDADAPNVVETLLKKQQDLEMLVNKYKEEKLEQLAVALASETLNFSNDPDQANEQTKSSLEDRLIREAWTLAQEAVNHELIQAEISHVTLRCGQTYEAAVLSEQEARLSLAAWQRTMHERWAAAVEQVLRREMEAGVTTLIERYETCLTHMKKHSLSRVSCPEEDAIKSRKLIFEFADIIAHKALVDARVTLIRQELLSEPAYSIALTSYSPKAKDSTIASRLLDAETVISTLSGDSMEMFNHASAEEFVFLFHQFFQEITSSLSECNDSCLPRTKSSDELVKIAKTVSELEETVSVICKCATPSEKERENEDRSEQWQSNASLSDICQRCQVLGERLTSVASTLTQTRECYRCAKLQDTMRRLNAEHEEELQMLQHCQQEEMAHLRGQLEQEKHSMVCRHEQEQGQMRERTRRLERRLGALDSEYAQQVENVRAVLGTSSEMDGGGTRGHRYRAEMEQLRALCQKGLAAMEASHRRAQAELREQHRRELEQARIEREQALAEETQATLAALDAMRKAHEVEVQREVTKFKAEFMRKMQASQDLGALHKEHEAEMEEVKQEILSLSERYSMKCVECASLEERLALLSQQLSQTQQHVQQLTSRNKQLRAHLVSEASDDGDVLWELQQRLESVTAHGVELRALCAQLDEGWECQAVLTRLRQLSASWPVRLPERRQSKSNTEKSARQHKEPAVLPRAELMRSPYRGCLNRHHSSFRCPSPCPLSGMVAERKKLFEN